MLVQRFCGKICKKIIKTHCIIHQQALRSRLLNFKHVMSEVVSTVNFIHSREHTHRLFQAFPQEVTVNYADLLYHTKVHWLSSGRLLQHFVPLRDETVQFLENYP
jgi:hypothetical protein